MLCGGRYGAMKPTLEGQWVHVICALWFPEISCKDDLMCEPILGIETIDSDRFGKVCLFQLLDLNLLNCVARYAVYVTIVAVCASRVTKKGARLNST